MSKKISLDGTICRASDCCGATILYNLEDIGINGQMKESAKPYCISCNQTCEIIDYVLVNKSRISNLTIVKQ